MFSEGPIFPNQEKNEGKKSPKTILMVTRHAERLPSGQLSTEGMDHAREKGTALANADVVKGYGSTHKSGRALETAMLISEESRVVSPVTGRAYRTKKAEGIQYDIAQPDLYHHLEKLKREIERKTIEACGLPVDTDIERLPISEQQTIAPIRQAMQRESFREALENKELTTRLAMGIAHQLENELGILNRYLMRREKAGSKPERDIYLNTVTHGLFIESLLLEAGVIKNQDSIAKIDPEMLFAQVGGPIQPAESIYLDIGDPTNVPELIPVMFEGNGRPAESTVFLVLEWLESLASKYREWKSNK